MERESLIRNGAGTLAGSAFVATTQILAGVAPLDLPLYVALTAFAVNIPFQTIIFFMPVPLTAKQAQHLEETGQPLSQSQQLYWSIHKSSTYFIIVGFAALFWHFAWWLGILFALAAWIAYRIWTRIGMEDFNQRPDEYE